MIKNNNPSIFKLLEHEKFNFISKSNFYKL